eukprot:1571928-Rhodomonas_salina.1
MLEPTTGFVVIFAAICIVWNIVENGKITTIILSFITGYGCGAASIVGVAYYALTFRFGIDTSGTSLQGQITNLGCAVCDNS